MLKILLDTKMVKLLKHYVLLYLSGFIKYFENSKRNMSFLADDDDDDDDDDVIFKYNKIWKKILKFYLALNLAVMK